LQVGDALLAGAAQVPVECGQGEAASFRSAQAHGVDDRPGRAVDRYCLAGRHLEAFDREIEGAGGVLGDFRRRVADGGAVGAAGHGDVHFVRDVVDQFVQAQGGFSAHHRIGGPRADGEQVEVRGGLGVGVPVDAARELVDPTRLPEHRQVARRKCGGGRRACGERRRKVRESFRQALLETSHV
jgi:hypothetical protein